MFNNDTNFLDQHFLIDNDIINLFYNTIDVKKNDTILEVGPGKGVITKLIKDECKKLIVVEKDKRLKEYLDMLNINVIYDDILKIDIPSVNKIVTSLPYSITEPFIYKLIDVDFDKLIMICGKNFVDNVFENKTKLAILVNSYFNIEKITDITPDSFDPKPKAMSSLIVLTNKNNLTKEETIIKMLFKYRYMKVKNALKEILIKLDNITQNEARKIINNYKIDETILNKLFDELSNKEVLSLINCIRD